MCGRIKGVRGLYTSLNIHKVVDKPMDQRFIRATDNVSIIRNVGAQRRVENATWWLLLERQGEQLKPSKYTSFNTRFDKLNVTGAAGYVPYRQSRCIIAAKGFGETEFVNKKPVHYYDMHAEQGGLVFGGLYREWRMPNSDKSVLSCSVITLPPHEKLKHIHSKAMPLILPQEQTVIDRWLDPEFSDTDYLDQFLTPNIPQNMIAQQIDKPSSHQAFGESCMIAKDGE